MRKLFLAVLAFLMFPAFAAVAQTNLTPQAFTYQGQAYTPAAVYQMGKDTVSGAPCFVGITSTCGSSGGGGGGGAVYGPNAAGTAPSQPPVLQGIYDGTNVQYQKGTTGGVTYVSGPDAKGVTSPTVAPIVVGGISTYFSTNGVQPLSMYPFNSTSWQPPLGLATISGLYGYNYNGNQGAALATDTRNGWTGSDVLLTNRSGRLYVRINTATSTNNIGASTGQHTLDKLVIGTPVAGDVITVFDAITATGTVVYKLTIPTSPQPMSIPLDVMVNTGLSILTTGTTDFTVVYQ